MPARPRSSATSKIRPLALSGLIAAIVVTGCAGAPTVGGPLVQSTSERLPLGDGQVSDHPVSGSVYACQSHFPPNGPGPTANGPWITGDHWDPSAKPTVDGQVAWPSEISIRVEGAERVVRGNGLPSHRTGVFPVASTDDAYAFDPNPNTISDQQVLLRLTASPRVADRPSCLPMGTIGIALSGAQLYNALDARGRDAPAHELQDSCNGHPQGNGTYHYHSLSECFVDSAGNRGQHSDLVGYALDGFGIYGPHGAGGVVVTNADLDACHGHTGPVVWNGTVQNIYHYHFTAEYPYSLGCFAGAPVGR